MKNFSTTPFTIIVKGTAAHGSQPHLGRDAIVAASSIILNLQTLVSRINSPLHPLALNIGTVKAGTQFNIISDTVTLTGELYTSEQAQLDEYLPLLKDMTQSSAKALLCSAEFAPVQEV